MTTLSKSKLAAYRQCPKRLWLEIHQPELRDDSGSEVAFSVGHEVGAIAQQIYDPSGTGENVDPNIIGWDAARERTAALLKSGKQPIFEAYLRTPDALALVDVMLPDTSGGKLRWQIIEVKSSSSVKDYHYDDVAIQSYLAEKSGISLSKIGIAHINNQFIYPGNGDYAGLLHLEDLTDHAKSTHAEVAAWIAEAQAVAALDAPPEVEVGPQCSSPYDCSFCNHCWANVATTENSISVLPRITARKVSDWESRGITELQDTPDDEINETQLRVKTATLAGETYFDAVGASRELADPGSTAYFMDFETIQFTVPRWTNTHPYQYIPFQFSVHVVSKDGIQSHTEFLDISGDDPREAFIQSLIKACGKQGPVYVYHAVFERSRLNELAMAFPAHATALEALTSRIVDLLPVARHHYYHPSQRGSWSLKAVFPAISPDLNYDQLEEVQDGNAAGQAYLKAIAPETTTAEREQTRINLLKYCEMDTLATVKIWQTFTGRHVV